MKLLIDIPKEFEQHFQMDRFEDSLHRLSADAHLLVGNYEQELAMMLIEAFKKVVLVPPHGRLGDLDELENRIKAWMQTTRRAMTEDVEPYVTAVLRGIQETPTIIPAEEEKT